MFNFVEIEKYITQFQPEGVIIDTQVLLLLLIGDFDQSLIDKCKVLSNFDLADYLRLKKILEYFKGKKIIITPHILAEMSNLSKKTFTDRSEKLYVYFHSVIEFLKSAQENTQPMKSFMDMDIKVISDYGFTDLGILEIAKSKNNKLAILTDDTELNAYSSGKVPVIKLGYFNDYQAVVRK